MLLRGAPSPSLGRTLLFFGLLIITAALVFAAGAPPAPSLDGAKPHAPMELFGIGPEMFEDRGGKWIDCFGNLGEKAIAKIGVIAIAVALGIQNFRQRTAIKERLDRQRDASERNRQDIAHIAAVAGTTTPSQTSSN